MLRPGSRAYALALFVIRCARARRELHSNHSFAAIEGRLARSVADRTLSILARLGIPTFHPALLDADAILGGLEEFREHLGGRLTVTLLRDIGVAEDVHALDPKLVRAAIADLRTAAPA